MFREALGLGRYNFRGGTFWRSFDMWHLACSIFNGGRIVQILIVRSFFFLVTHFIILKEIFLNRVINPKKQGLVIKIN